MSYGDPAAPARPNSVTWASRLLYVLAGLTVLSAILTLAVLGKTFDAAKRAYANVENGDTVVTITKVATVVSLVISLVFALLYVLMARGILRGSNAWRITTFVIAGLGVLCFGCGLVGGAAGGSFGGKGGNANSQEMQDAANRMRDAIPSWSTASSTVLSLISLALVIGVIIMLALPASSAFFRKPAQQFIPPPGYPQAPGSTPAGPVDPPYPPTQ